MKVASHIFISSYHTVFIIHAKTANNLCGKVKPITSDGISFPKFAFYAAGKKINELCRAHRCIRKEGKK